MSIYLGVDLKLLDEHLKKPKKNIETENCFWPLNKLKNRPHPSLNRTEKKHTQHTITGIPSYISSDTITFAITTRSIEGS